MDNTPWRLDTFRQAHMPPRRSGNAPAYGLYPGTQGPDPYTYYSGPAGTVNLTGKISADPVPNQQNRSSILSSVSSAMESGYMSARQVVFGGSDAAAPTSSGSFSLFSLSYQQIINFAICIAIGLFFMFLAFLFLPMVVFAPQKFTLLFTLGCLSWIAGLSMLQGPKSLVAAMMQKERLPFSIGYLTSLLGTFYATLIAHSYILTIMFAVAQITTLGAFIVSYFPGGIRVLYMVKDLIVERAKGAFGRGGNTSVLPL